jgi:DNA-binding transcriptional MerR regulator
MKTGTAAKRFDVDQNTIIAWTKRFSEFFTKEALAEGQTQRDYQFEDVIVLNTIRVERSKNTTWEEIRALLGSGYRDENLPPEFTSIDGTKAISLYAELRELSVQLRKANEEIERVRKDQAAEREQMRQQQAVERERYEKRIESLIREATEWKIRYEVMKEQLDDEV